MFENTTNAIHKDIGTPPNLSWLYIIVALFVMWFVLALIREFWTWFWKTTAINTELEEMNTRIQQLIVVGQSCQTELSRANSKLERIAEKASAVAGNQATGSGGK